MEQRIELVATCLFGLEKFLGEEIDALGYRRIETIDGRITFSGPLSAIARANMFLRFAEKVLHRTMHSLSNSPFISLT